MGEGVLCFEKLVRKGDCARIKARKNPTGKPANYRLVEHDV
jgi:hypothetical protein